jgi:hypothetical protein
VLDKFGGSRVFLLSTIKFADLNVWYLVMQLGKKIVGSKVPNNIGWHAKLQAGWS